MAAAETGAASCQPYSVQAVRSLVYLKYISYGSRVSPSRCVLRKWLVGLYSRSSTMVPTLMYLGLAWESCS